ncbi:MAG: hypothetical protein NVV68_00795 [Dokdonella sp.]|nr:hypothetical protein [Dokdonella sp.]
MSRIHREGTMQTIRITAGGRVTGALIATLAATAATPGAHAAGAVPAGARPR